MLSVLALFVSFCRLYKIPTEEPFDFPRQRHHTEWIDWIRDISIQKLNTSTNRGDSYVHGFSSFSFTSFYSENVARIFWYKRESRGVANAAISTQWSVNYNDTRIQKQGTAIRRRAYFTL